VAKKDLLLIFLLLTVFVSFILVKHKSSLSYSFDQGLVDKYLRSQDIEDTKDEIKDRIFLSDSDLYIASGYLYSRGNDPTKYNFQHPPLIKYLYGYSIRLFNNPFIVQMFLGAILVTLTYFLGMKTFKNRLVSVLGTAFLFLDPVFSSMFGEALLDLGQASFSLLYVISVLFYPTSFIFQGATLGLFASSKFWSTSLFFIAILYGYKLLNKKETVSFKALFLSFVFAFITFSLTYLKSFIENGGLFNIVFFQGKVLKFMIDHNSAVLVGGPAILFLTGYFSNWWRDGISRVGQWTILWPISFVNSLYQMIKIRKIKLEFLFFFLPVAYLLYISGQVPFPRYFIIILPYFYLGLAYSLIQAFKNWTSKSFPR
jgi:hypothetical protein